MDMLTANVNLGEMLPDGVPGMPDMPEVPGVEGDDLSANSAEGETEEETSGAERMQQKMYLACASPFFMLFCLILLGWNEKRAVCDAKAIIKGKEVAIEAACNANTSNINGLIVFSCELQKDELTPPTPLPGITGTNYQGICMQKKSVLYQCKETVTSKTEKTSGGGTKTIKTYSYAKAWSGSKLTRSYGGGTATTANKAKARSACGANYDSTTNANLLQSTGKTYIPKAHFGSYKVGGALLKSVACNTPVAVSSIGSPWRLDGGAIKQGPNPDNIGTLKVSYVTNSWAADKIMHTVLGKNTAEGIVPYSIPGSWLCGAQDISDLRSGTNTKDQLFEAMAAENTTTTWALRFFGFLFLWCSCTCMFGPCEVLADCIPMIGPMLGDMIEAIICCMTCPPASCCCFFVCAIVWIAMRPIMGALFLVGSLCFFCAAGGGLFMMQKNKNEAKQAKDEARWAKQEAGEKVGMATEKE